MYIDDIKLYLRSNTHQFLPAGQEKLLKSLKRFLRINDPPIMLTVLTDPQNGSYMYMHSL